MTDIPMAVAGNDTLDRGRVWVVTYLVTTGVVLVLMMLAGLAMRLAQSGWLALDPALFYER